MIGREKSYVVYEVTGESVFPVPFTLASGSVLQVLVRHAAGSMDELAEGGDWSFDESTGQVELSVPLVQGDLLVIRRRTPASNETALLAGRPINPDTLNLQNDKAMAAIQEVRDQSDRAVVSPDGEEGVILPSASTRAGTIVQWDVEGKGFEPLTRQSLLDEAKALAHKEVLEYTPIMSTYASRDDFPEKGTDGRLYCEASTDYVWRYSAQDGRYHQITTDMSALAARVPVITYDAASETLRISLGADQGGYGNG